MDAGEWMLVSAVGAKKNPHMLIDCSDDDIAKCKPLELMREFRAKTYEQARAVYEDLMEEWWLCVDNQSL